MINKIPIVIIGLGNDFRSDDGVGLFIARELSKMNLAGVKTVEGVSDGTTLLEIWDKAMHAYVIDAVASGENPGTVFRFEPVVEDIPADYFSNYSTHSFNVVESVRLAKVLNKLPSTLIVFGIEGKDFSAGAGLSAPVEKSAIMIINRIRDEIEAASVMKKT